MTFKEFFKPTVTKIALTILLILFLPFLIYSDPQGAACTDSIPSNCSSELSQFEFVLPPFTLNLIFYSIGGVTGTEDRNMVIFYNLVLLILKTIISYSLTCLTFYLYNKTNTK